MATPMTNYQLQQLLMRTSGYGMPGASEAQLLDALSKAGVSQQEIPDLIKSIPAMGNGVADEATLRAVYQSQLGAAPSGMSTADMLDELTNNSTFDTSLLTNKFEPAAAGAAGAGATAAGAAATGGPTTLLGKTAQTVENGAQKLKGTLGGGAKSLGEGIKNNLAETNGGQFLGTTVGKISTIGNGIVNGIGTVSNLKDISENSTASTDTRNDVLRIANSDPYAVAGLDAKSKSLLRQLKNGGKGEFDSGAALGEGLKGAGMGALTGFLTGGGIPGAIVGAIGGGLKGATGGVATAQQKQNAEMQGLYDQLNAANQQRMERRRNRFSNMGY